MLAPHITADTAMCHYLASRTLDMKRSAPIYLLALCIFSIVPVGVFWNWMAAVDSLRPYSTHAPVDQLEGELNRHEFGKQCVAGANPRGLL